jgi:hypothetical protein
MELGLSYYGKNKDGMFEKRVLWRILMLNRKKVIGNWRNLHNLSSTSCTLRQFKTG